MTHREAEDKANADLKKTGIPQVIYSRRRKGENEFTGQEFDQTDYTVSPQGDPVPVGYRRSTLVDAVQEALL